MRKWITIILFLCLSVYLQAATYNFEPIIFGGHWCFVHDDSKPPIVLSSGSTNHFTNSTALPEDVVDLVYVIKGNLTLMGNTTIGFDHDGADETKRSVTLIVTGNIISSGGDGKHNLILVRRHSKRKLRTWDQTWEWYDYYSNKTPAFGDTNLLVMGDINADKLVTHHGWRQGKRI